MNSLLLTVSTLFLAICLGADQTALAFKPAADGGFEFDTGVLRGKLRAGGKSLGLSAVTQVPTGTRLDHSNGLFSHYRVFTRGQRYGGGAWDWPSTARLEAGGTVRVDWPSAEGRPLSMQAVYRWHDDHTLDLETIVRAKADLPAFESFLASYFQESFTNALVYAASAGDRAAASFLAAEPSEGDWQMFARDDAAVTVIQDGRWKLEPNPVAWRIRARFAQPLALRKSPATGLLAALMAPATDCFAIALPHQTEGHYSLYLSLFGRDLKAGETARARARLMITSGQGNADLPPAYEAYRKSLGAD